mmetsp:Transcript_19372/g.33524  ORF Transcript_19372/g.33524 Transcript_19372/m.33524 type:complete len:96 (-) Transcript_19372:263-550(-)
MVALVPPQLSTLFDFLHADVTRDQQTINSPMDRKSTQFVRIEDIFKLKTGWNTVRSGNMHCNAAQLYGAFRSFEKMKNAHSPALHGVLDSTARFS